MQPRPIELEQRITSLLKKSSKVMREFKTRDLFPGGGSGLSDIYDFFTNLIKTQSSYYQFFEGLRMGQRVADVSAIDGHKKYPAFHYFRSHDYSLQIWLNSTIIIECDNDTEMRKAIRLCLDFDKRRDNEYSRRNQNNVPVGLPKSLPIGDD